MKKSGISLLLGWWLVGCAHYTLPVSHLETPESRGLGRMGRWELIGILSGTDLNAQPTRYQAAKNWMNPDESPSTPPVRPQQSFANYAMGFMLPIAEKIDVGIRFQPYAPLLIRGKFQWMGQSEAKAETNQFAVAVSAMTGVMLGKGSNNASFSYFIMDGALPLGYRMSDKHLVSLTPYLTMVSISNMPVALATLQNANTYSASVTQYGWALGYQYTLESLMVRMELAFNYGILLDTSIQNLYYGALVGLQL